MPLEPVKASDLNRAYIAAMEKADDRVSGQLGLARIRRTWWPAFLEAVEENGADASLDALDRCMDKGRKAMYEMAEEYATAKGHEAGSEKYRQIVGQFLKSNTGKMFERFSGLALAYVLLKNDAPYGVIPFSDKWLARSDLDLKRIDFDVTVRLGGEYLKTAIDADLLVLAPGEKDAPIYQLSMKSTLKDRFHNVPFWNLLRLCALSEDHSHIVAANREVLERARYVAICSDLAAEQPDFQGEKGPRNLLRLDAALLDGAFVTASKAKGVSRETPSLGGDRPSAFNYLSQLANDLSSL
jgi:hypothetical protein